MKKTLLSAGIISTLSLSFSNLSAQTEHWCGTMEKVMQSIAHDPSLQVELDNFYQFVQANQDEIAETNRGGSNYVVPVVVHVIHNYGAENISDAQIFDAINVLNEDYNATSPDTASVVASFKSIVGNAQFEFRLAKLDPNGNCTNGITRTVSTLTDKATDDSKIIYWPRNKYYNMWIVRDIDEGENASGVTAGYAYLPGSAPSANVDGILIQHNYFGTIGTSNGNNFNKRVCSHETGHFFGLLHTWGWGTVGTSCSGSDFVNDTPPTQGNFSTCNLSATSCGPLENVQNIMDYSSCTNMFTQGQVSAMISGITGSGGQRNGLWQSSNLVATGTNDGYVAQDCAPIVDFSSSFLGVCAGSSITFTDHTWNATPTSWNWTFDNGTTQMNATTQNPTITFTEEGTYNVTLSVSAPGGNGSLTKNSMVYVFDGTAQESFYEYEDKFDSNPITTGRWLLPYAITPASGWEETTQSFYSSPNAVMVDNYNATAGQVYNIVSPSYDFSQVPQPVTLSFKYAYAKRNNNNFDVLKVYLSSNCGQTWIVRGTYTADDLATTSNKTSDWFPTSTSSWTSVTLTNLNAFYSKPNVRIKFEFTSGGGNNLFLDDINIAGPLGIDDATKEDIGLSLYPNPVNDMVNIHFLLDKKYEVGIKIADISGRVVYVQSAKEYAAGEVTIPVSLTDNISSGLYLVEVTIGNKRYVERLIKN